MELGDFGFVNDEHLIEQFYFDWVKSGYTITPDGKPWLDQDEQFWNDVHTYEAKYLEKAKAIRASKRG